jgi:hypothetical protein
MITTQRSHQFFCPQLYGFRSEKDVLLFVCGMGITRDLAIKLRFYAVRLVNVIEVDVQILVVLATGILLCGCKSTSVKREWAAMSKRSQSTYNIRSHGTQLRCKPGRFWANAFGQ